MNKSSIQIAYSPTAFCNAGFCCESGSVNTKSIPIGGDNYENLSITIIPTTSVLLATSPTSMAK
ncbi:MAG: hypothetical protein ACK5L5_08515 [Bacteroidales bacterium]